SDTGAGVDVPVLVGQATLPFNPVGRIDESNAAAAAINGTINWANGAAASPITIDLKSFTQYAGGSLVTNAVQDGRGAGEISSYEFDTNGGIYAILDTGERAQVGSLPVAIFQNVDGLERSGSSVYSRTIDNGEMQLGTPGRGARGGLKGAALESSNVDIANQFVDLVIYQRGYQANSQVLSAASDILKGTIALIR
ncbi:MAG: flagellar hook-basal body complex protein, partial [bacterium]